jgi:hypothetical protein
LATQWRFLGRNFDSKAEIVEEKIFAATVAGAQLTTNLTTCITQVTPSTPLIDALPYTSPPQSPTATMKFTTFALTIALAATQVSADSLRGAAEAGTLNQLGQADVHCNRKDYTATTCSDATSSDGSNCVWCQTKEDEGACLSTTDADKVINLFGMACPDYTALLEEADEDEGEDEGTEEVEEKIEEDEEDLESS